MNLESMSHFLFRPFSGVSLPQEKVVFLSRVNETSCGLNLVYFFNLISCSSPSVPYTQTLFYIMLQWYLTSLHLCSTMNPLKSGTKFDPSKHIPSTLHVPRVYHS